MSEIIETKKKASVLRKVFNILSLVVNIFRFFSATVIFLMIVGILMIGALIVLGFQLDNGGDMIPPFLWSIAYLVPAIIMMVLSIVSTVKCFKHGYKKVLELTTYIISLILCLIDLIIGILNFEAFFELMILSIPCSIVSIILLVIAIIACVTDEVKKGGNENV